MTWRPSGASAAEHGTYEELAPATAGEIIRGLIPDDAPIGTAWWQTWWQTSPAPLTREQVTDALADLRAQIEAEADLEILAAGEMAGGGQVIVYGPAIVAEDGHLRPTWEEITQAFYRARTELNRTHRAAILDAFRRLPPDEGDLDRPINLDPDAWIAWIADEGLTEIPHAGRGLTLDQLLGPEVAALIADNKLPPTRGGAR